MILAIGIYYLIGIVIGIVNGIYCAIVYDKITPDELSELVALTRERIGLSSIYQDAGEGCKLLLNAISFAILPFIAIAFGISLVRACDQFMNEKNKEEAA